MLPVLSGNSFINYICGYVHPFHSKHVGYDVVQPDNMYDTIRPI